MKPMILKETRRKFPPLINVMGFFELVYTDLAENQNATLGPILDLDRHYFPTVTLKTV